MKKILICTDTTPQQVSGVVRTLENTSRVLTNRGHKVEFVTPLDFKSFPLPGYPEILFSFPHSMIERFLGFDAIHIATEGNVGLAARNACVKHDIPFTTAYHTNFPMYLKKFFCLPEAISYAYLRWFHKHSKAVMTPTNTMISLLKSKGFKNVVKWGRGVDSELFKPREVFDLNIGPRPYFLNVGRVSPEKNLEAFLSLDLPGTKIIIGDGPSMPSLKRSFPKTIFLGAMSGTELAHWYNRADVFVFPSKTDTFGLVIAEAISSGIPVAAYPVSGPIDIIENGKTGFINENLQEAALNCLDLKEIVCDFSWDMATDQFFGNLSFL